LTKIIFFFCFFFRRIQADDLPFIAACKEDVKLFKSGRKAVDKSPEQQQQQLRRLSTDSRGSTAAVDSPPAALIVTDQRRERKSKFSVKDIFNLRKHGVGSSPDVGSGDTSTPDPPKAEGGDSVAVKAAAAAQSSIKKHRNSSIIKINAGSDAKVSVESGDVLLRSDKGDHAACASSRVGDGVSPSIAPTASSNARQGRGGGLQTRRRGKRSDIVQRPLKRNRDGEDRSGNSPQVTRLFVS
jgi:hypothetical protein